MVCADDWETRHPQEFIRPVKDNHPLPWTRPDKDLNADGTPRLSQAPTFNCSGATLIMYEPRFQYTQTIGKGYTIGPMFVDDGATLTINCSMVVD